MSHRSAHPPSYFAMPLRLESQTQSKLNVATLLATGGHDSLVGGDGCISPGEHVSARIDEHVGVVEEVEEFRAELQVHALAQELDALVQPEVEGPEPRRVEKVARRDLTQGNECRMFASVARRIFV